MKNNQKKLTPNAWPWGAILVLTSLSLRLIYFFQFKKTFFFDHLQLDPRYYWEWGGRIAKGEILGSATFDASPLYPYFLGAYRYFFGDNTAYLYLIQSILGTVTVYLVYRLAKKLFGLRAGIFAGLIMAAYKPEIMFNNAVTKPSLSALFIVGMTGLLVGSGSLGSMLSAGLLLGLTAVNDSHYLIVTPFVLFWLFRNRPDADKYQSSLAILLGMLLAFSPGIARNYLVSGEFTLVRAGGGYVFYIGSVPEFKGEYRSPEFVRANVFVELNDFQNEARRRTGNPDLTIKEASNFWYKEGWRLIKKQPLVYLKNVLRRFMIFWNAYEYPDMYNYQFLKKIVPLLNWWLIDFGLLAPLALAGLGLTVYRERRFDLLSLIVIACCLSLMPFKVFGRLRFGMLPLLTVFAGRSVVLAYENQQKNEKKQLVVGLALLVAAIILVHWPLQLQRDLHIANSYTNLGLNYQKYDQPLKAMESYLKAIRTERSYVEAHDALRSLQSDIALQNLPQGLSLLNQAYDEVAEIYLSAADESLQANDYQNALTSYNISLNFKLDNFEAFLGGAQASFHLKKYANAKLYLKKAKTLKPDDPTLDQFIAQTNMVMREKADVKK